MKKFIRKYRLAILLQLLFIGCGGLASAAGKIALVLSDRNKIYILISQGLKENLKGEVQEFNLQEQSADMLDGIRQFGPDLVVSIGNAAALWSQKSLQGVPTIAAGVITQYSAENLKNIPGVRLEFPISSYLRLVRDSLPKVKRIGMVFNPVKDSQTALEYQKQAEELDMRIIAEPIQKEKDISRALQNLKSSGVDVFMMTYDPLIMNPESFKYLVDFTITYRIGLVVPSKTLLKNGGIVSLEADYLDVGRQAAVLVEQYQKDPGSVSKSRMSAPEKEEIGLNLRMAEVLNIQFPETAVHKADYLHR